MAITAPAGTNYWTKVEDTYVDVLATFSSVQSFLGVADANAAKAGNMFLDALPQAQEEMTRQQFESYHPHVLIATPGDEVGAFRLVAGATGPVVFPVGILELVISLVDNDIGLQDGFRQIKNKAGDILAELVASTVVAPGEITVQYHNLMYAPNEEDLGRVWSCVSQIAWGVEPAAGGET